MAQGGGKVIEMGCSTGEDLSHTYVYVSLCVCVCLCMCVICVYVCVHDLCLAQESCTPCPHPTSWNTVIQEPVLSVPESVMCHGIYCGIPFILLATGSKQCR